MDRPQDVLVATATATGSSHLTRRSGSDDAVGWSRSPDGNRVVLAVADGHSDPRCIRAARGARLAVRAALEACVAEDATERTIGSAILTRWRELVDADVDTDPLPGEPGDDEARWLAYGTTVLACAIDPAAVLLVQIGDGDIVTVTDTDPARRPIAPDGLEGSPVTASLSTRDAQRSARVSVLEHDALPALVTLSTDGLDNAYPTRTALLAAADELLAAVHQDGPRAIQAQLDPWVRLAAATSGDDATVAVAVLTPRAQGAES